MMIPRRRIVLTILLFMLITAFTVGCAGPATLVSMPAVPAATSTAAISQTLNGAHVGVLGLWSGPELESFMRVKAAWEKDTGGIVDWDTGPAWRPDRPHTGRKSARYRDPAQPGVDAAIGPGREVGAAQLFYGHGPGQQGLCVGLDRPGQL